jgi:hypothetical protein
VTIVLNPRSFHTPGLSSIEDSSGRAMDPEV